VQARIKVDGRAIAPMALSCRPRQSSAARKTLNAALHHVSPGTWSNLVSYRGPGTAINRLLVLGLSVQDVSARSFITFFAHIQVAVDRPDLPSSMPASLPRKR